MLTRILDVREQKTRNFYKTLYKREQKNTRHKTQDTKHKTQDTIPTQTACCSNTTGFVNGDFFAHSRFNDRVVCNFITT